MDELERKEERQELKLEIIEMLERRNKERREQQLSNSHNNVAAQELYRKSINAKPTKVHGKTYVSKNHIKNVKVALQVAVGIAVVVLGVKGANIANQLSEYQHQLNVTAAKELSHEEYQQYLKDHNSSKFFSNVIDHYQDLKETEDYLKENGNYNAKGDNIDFPDKYPLTKDEVEGVFILTDLQKDAISEAVDNEIEEYKGRGK